MYAKKKKVDVVLFLEMHNLKKTRFFFLVGETGLLKRANNTAERCCNIFCAEGIGSRARTFETRLCRVRRASTATVFLAWHFCEDFGCGRVRLLRKLGPGRHLRGTAWRCVRRHLPSLQSFCLLSKQ